MHSLRVTDCSKESGDIETSPKG